MVLEEKDLLNAIVINDTEDSSTAWNLCVEMKENGLLAKPTHGKYYKICSSVTYNNKSSCVECISSTIMNSVH
jgi:ornithine--oxo-acid transaminase